MADITLTPKRLFEGIWEAILEGATTKPEITVSHLDRPVDGVTLTEAGKGGQWLLKVPVPAKAICDGVQTFLVQDVTSGATLGSFSLISGEALGDDMRAEMDLLRAELDMLKRAFRRHCLETM